ncbi:MAG: TolC family protein [Desmonostoc geniculatum HA4340-LM1]|jgi:OMF family outer membrane factor|nr:TolC family protein [Desmonostoc geniculatum HA4340-LM1]
MSAHHYIIVAGINCTIALIDIAVAAAQVIDYLNPSPNFLEFPFQSEKVKNQAITLQQALELARRNNLELQAVLFQVERSRAALREVQANIYPSISLSTDLSRAQSAFSKLYAEQLGEQAQFLRTQGFSQDEPTTTFNSSLQLSYSLYNFGPGASTRGATKEQVRVDELEVERLSEEIRLNVTLDYYNLQQADEQVRINQSAVQNSEASLRDAKALQRAGVGTTFDVLRSQVNLANAQQDLTNAISQQQIARRRLATRLNLAESVNISAADPVQLSGLWQLTVEETIILALYHY